MDKKLYQRLLEVEVFQLTPAVGVASIRGRYALEDRPCNITRCRTS